MGKDERKGARRDRNQRISKRIPELGYYFVVTDTQATEINYLNGLRDSIPDPLRNRLVIKVSKAPTSELVDKCLEMVDVDPQYRRPWIVFDRDRVKDFDKIIESAERQGVHTGWSNPCVEIWFHAYFGNMPVTSESTQCIDAFGTEFRRKTGRDYNKTDDEIYKKLCKYGDENNAIATAANRLRQCDDAAKPSERLSTTTLFLLIDEIRAKCGS
jgi:hypothetical protein